MKRFVLAQARIVFSHILTVLFLALSCASVGATEQNEDLFLRTTPIFPGEQRFRDRLATASPDEQPLGLLLSGGSARAYAHIGVLKRLEEADITPDFIVANSMGGIVALLYATGMSPEDIEDIISTTPMAELFSPKLPLGGGLMNPFRYMDVLYDMFGDIRIEDLPIPVLIVCNDLVAKRQVWITEGDLYTVMRAAFSMPVYFDPVLTGDYRLVDGGITNLVPVNVLASFTNRMIVATTFYQNDRLNYRNPLTILNLNFSIGKELSAIEMIEKYDPPLIRCDVEDISFMDFAKISLIVKRGYDSTDRAIGAIEARTGKNPRAPPENRRELSAKKDETQKRLCIGTPLYHHDKRALARIALCFPASYNSPFHFIEDPYAALFVTAEKGPIGIDIGPSSSMLEFEPAASMFLHFGPFGPISLDSYHRYTADTRYTEATARALFYLPFPAAWMPFVDAEIMADGDFRATDAYHRAGITLFTTANHRFRPEISAYAFTRKPEIYGIGGEASLAVSPFYPLEFRGRAIGRYGLSGDDDFAIFKNDGYRGILSEGTSLPHAVMNAEIALNADRVSLGFAETILMERVDAALYVDVIESSRRSIATGASITSTLSLIGLSPITLTLFGGWDITEEAPFVTMKVGSLFRDRTR